MKPTSPVRSSPPLSDAAVLRLLPAAGNDLRARDDELADFAWRGVIASVGEDPDVGIEHRHSDRHRPVRESTGGMLLCGVMCVGDVASVRPYIG